MSAPPDPLAPYVAKPGLYLGPLVLGAFFQALLQGILVDMTWSYFIHGTKENRFLKAVVVFLTVASLFQTSAALYDLWNTFVINFGRWGQALSFSWVQKIQTVYQATLAAPVQGYYIWRCFKVTHNNYFVLIPLCMLLGSSWAVAVNTTYRVFQVNFGQFPSMLQCSNPDGSIGYTSAVAHLLTKREMVIPVDIIFIYWLVSSAVVDISVASILLLFLVRSRSTAYGSMDSVMRKLIWTVWECGMPPAICALTTCVIYIVMVKSTNHNVDLFFQQIIGKLYVISLMITLNTRLEISQSRHMMSYEMGPTSRKDFKASVRVDIRTDHEPPTFSNTVTMGDDDDESEHHRRHRGVGARSNSLSKDSGLEQKSDSFPYRQDVELSYRPDFGDVKGGVL